MRRVTGTPSPLQRFADILDRLAGLPTCSDPRLLNFPRGLVDPTLSLQVVIVCQIADRLLIWPFPRPIFPSRSFLFHM